MSEHDVRIRVDRFDWLAVLPWLALFRTGRMALHPAKLLLALLLVALLYLGGLAMDVAWGVPAEGIEQPVDAWPTLHIERAVAIEARRLEAEVGVFAATLAEQQDGFARLMQAAVRLDFGVVDLIVGHTLEHDSVVGALHDMFVAVPCWLFRFHPAFTLVYLAWMFIITAILGGVIARLAALHACIDRRGSLFAALRFVGKRYPWFFLAPLIPIALVALVGAMLMVVGLLFNVTGLDVVGAIAYGLLLFGGGLATLLLIGLATGGHLLLPSLAVEGTDAFDAVSRAYNYVFGRPWRYLFYTAVSLVYGAVVYLALSLLVFMALWLTWSFAGQWVFTQAGDDVNRFAALLGEPTPGKLVSADRVNELEMGALSRFAALIMRGWSYLIVALLPAFAVSFYFCANTWVYLLLRRAADGTERDDVYLDDDPAADLPPEKLEPTPT